MFKLVDSSLGSQPHAYGETRYRYKEQVLWNEPTPTWVGSDILPDGDPQAGYPAILVLTGNRSYPSVFTLSRLSQARGNP